MPIKIAKASVLRSAPATEKRGALARDLAVERF
jgi:hypothetical protein